MPNKNFNDLTIATTTDGTELVPVVSSGVTSAISVSNINSGIIADTISDVTNADDLSVGQSSIAAGVSSLVSSITQQDLTGVNTVGLHRNSSAAVTSMFIYDTSKDSDGGAWTEKCQHTSWYNEPLSGKWLGAQPSEFFARYEGANLGPTLLSNWQLESSWSENAGVVFSGNTLEFDANSDRITKYILLTPGQVYELKATVTCTNAAYLNIDNDGGGAGVSSTQYGNINNYTTLIRFTVTTNSTRLRLIQTGSGTISLTSFSIKQITTINTSSNDYYQNSTDGKFYRLWKNLLKYSEDFNNALWVKTNLSVVTNNETAPDGTPTADQLIENSVNGYHHIDSNSTSVIPGYYSIRVYLKANGKTLPVVQFKGVANEGYAVYDLTGVTATATNATASITSVGNGWYLCKLTVQATASGTGYVRIFLDNSQYQGNSVSGIYIWGVQLEYGSTVTTYEPKGIEGSSSEVSRGNKKSFPKLSAIVAEDTSITIYDLTETNRPMWMRFVRNTGNILQLESASKVYSLLAINSVIYIGQGAAGVCLNEVNFYKDSAEAFATTTTDGGKFKSNIAGRNSGVGRLPTTITTPAGRASVMSFVILDGSPIDNISGLPIPTLAIGYNNGVFFKKNNGTFSTNWNSSFGELTTLYFKKKFIIASGWQSGSFAYATFNPTIQEITGWTNNTSTDAVDFNIGNTYGLISSTSNDVIRKSSNSATVQKLKPCDRSINNSIASTITNTYNTGYQIGDIRRTYLSTNISGDITTTSNLVINGDFSANSTDGWVKSPYHTLTVENQQLKIASSNYIKKSYYAVSTIPGCSYVFSVLHVLRSGGNGVIGLYFDISLTTANSYYENLSANPDNTTYYIKFDAKTTTTYIALGARENAGYQIFDDVYLALVESDRSYKNKTTTITGTLTKTQVATGAQLVAYSGFSA